MNHCLTSDHSTVGKLCECHCLFSFFLYLFRTENLNLSLLPRHCLIHFSLSAVQNSKFLFFVLFCCCFSFFLLYIYFLIYNRKYRDAKRGCEVLAFNSLRIIFNCHHNLKPTILNKRLVSVSTQFRPVNNESMMF